MEKLLTPPDMVVTKPIPKRKPKRLLTRREELILEQIAKQKEVILKGETVEGRDG